MQENYWLSSIRRSLSIICPVTAKLNADTGQVVPITVDGYTVSHYDKTKVQIIGKIQIKVTERIPNAHFS